MTSGPLALVADPVHLVMDIWPGPECSCAIDPTVAGGMLFFGAQDGTSGYELWKSDGRKNGTVLPKDINPGPDSSDPDELTNVGGTRFFRAFDGTTSGLSIARRPSGPTHSS